MARAKRAPVKRESSSEFFNKQTATWDETNGDDGRVKGANGHREAAHASGDDASRSDAGLVQLVISVAGIYASL